VDRAGGLCCGVVGGWVGWVGGVGWGGWGWCRVGGVGVSVGGDGGGRLYIYIYMLYGMAIMNANALYKMMTEPLYVSARRCARR
jgi:hypothetical protein